MWNLFKGLASASHLVAVEACPNIEGVAIRQANGNLALCNQLVTRTKQCISPGLRFFQRKFRQEFHDLVRAFKSARLCCPVQVQNLHLNAASLAELRKFNFLNNDGLVNELPRYLAAADGTVIEEEEELGTVVGEACTHPSQLVCCGPEATSSAAKFCFG